MSPSRKKPGAPREANRNHASPAAVGDLQALVDQVQALRRRHKAQPSAQSAAELSRLRAATARGPRPRRGRHRTRRRRQRTAPTTSSEADDEAGYRRRYGRGVGGGRVGRVARPAGLVPVHPAKRIPVDDGLELRSRRGVIGERWWSRRFLSAVESILTGGRLTRGRTYARQGQVIDLGIGSGLVVPPRSRARGAHPTGSRSPCRR